MAWRGERVGQRGLAALVLVATAATLGGCADAAARRYAVTLQEPAVIDCQATARVGEATETKNMADNLEEAGLAAYAQTPPRPVGRRLDVMEHDDEVSSWLDLGLSAAAADYFGGPEEVMLGLAHDDYVQVVYRRTHLVDDEEQAEALGIEPCGELEDASTELSVTVDGDVIEGRLRRKQTLYHPLGLSQCDEKVECPRDLALTGVVIE
ncbi:MAG: hypothetical protein WKG00_37530 [Polyangiaceae bacterium]